MPFLNKGHAQVADPKIGGVMNDSSALSQVTFPVPWTSRCQTPVKRVKSGTLYGTPDEYVPDTYGKTGL